jgi:hypothetical protein
MRHLTLEEQLQIQDGEGLPAAAEHLASCGQCVAERERLKECQGRLRALPTRRPSSDGWPALRNAIVASRRRRTAAVGLALAASLAGLLFIPTVARRSPAVSRPEVARSEGPAPTESSLELEALITQSKALDEKLQRLPSRQVIDVATADSIVELEDQVALIDQFIASLRREGGDSQEVSALWRARIELLEVLIAERTPPLTVVL